LRSLSRLRHRRPRPHLGIGLIAQAHMYGHHTGLSALAGDRNNRSYTPLQTSPYWVEVSLACSYPCPISFPIDFSPAPRQPEWYRKSALSALRALVSRVRQVHLRILNFGEKHRAFWTPSLKCPACRAISCRATLSRFRAISSFAISLVPIKVILKDRAKHGSGPSRYTHPFVYWPIGSW
jgi:hypothetical protein